MKPQCLELFIQDYIACALWSSTGEDDEPLDRRFANRNDDSEVFAPETLKAMREECRKFCEQNSEHIESVDYQLAGHDFWLTRNGHGAGFWDGDWPDPQADILTESSKQFGEVWLYVGDDGLIYQSK